ncbi:hypothetical protein E3N88_19883 [Mikania micrantha]|uniref:Small ribosomal subunit protein eS31 domain-containing protein n=1 Tax=Mikania micrantha TaxID=192012 RepID=A0A5N6NSK9_9ASTR|nr:hypothetical protein E3N88_19883 [Mikania micrantha]
MEKEPQSHGLWVSRYPVVFLKGKLDLRTVTTLLDGNVVDAIFASSTCLLINSKRKKKTYTKPKKIKHKHKKVKLSVLQFYKVDDSGKVQRLRKECPNAECGAGTFMANHFDRHYCAASGVQGEVQKARSLEQSIDVLEDPKCRTPGSQNCTTVEGSLARRD